MIDELARGVRAKAARGRGLKKWEAALADALYAASLGGLTQLEAARLVALERRRRGMSIAAARRPIGDDRAPLAIRERMKRLRR